MLTPEDIQAIAALMSNQKADIIREVNVIFESQIEPQLNALAEGQQTLLDKLAPKSRVEELESEVALLKSIIRLHSNDIAELKKAQ